MDTRKRVAALRRTIDSEKIGALVISNVPNVSYISGFTGDDSLALVTGDRKYLITDFRYVEQVEQECPGWTIIQHTKGSWAAAADVLKRNRVRKAGFESAHLSHRNWRLLASETKRIKLAPTVAAVEKLREIKDADEVKAMRSALKAQQTAFEKMKQWVRPGMTECHVARQLEHLMGMEGSEKPSFETIVAAGPRGSLPHAHPTQRVAHKGDALLIDWGARRFSYNSDLTRVLHFGKVSTKFERIYDVVKQAQALAIAAVKPGMKLGELDAVARDYISARGFGSRFGHSLGHGIGLEVHERPAVRRGNEERVLPGMVFTVEPGIYIPGWGGVRIEDMVLVTETGARVLSSCEKDLGKMIL